jgi:hypothetical protein
MRGMLRMKRLIAVPPLSAKSFSAATNGRTWISNAACRRYRSATGIEIRRHGDVEFRIELSTALQHPLARPQIYLAAVDLLQPCMIVPLRKPEEEPLDLDATAIGEQLLEPFWAEASHALHQHVGLTECFMPRQSFREIPLQAV